MPHSRLRLPRRPIAIAVSLLVHALVLGALGWGLRGAVTESEPPPVVVRLVRLWPEFAAPRKVAPAPAEPRMAAHLAATARSPARPTGVTPSHTPVAPAAVPGLEPSPPQARGASPDLQNALRGSLDCDNADFYRMSAQERSRCRDHLRALAQIGGSLPQFGMSLERRADFDAEEARARAPAHQAKPECVLLFSQGKVEWYRPAESIKLGPLPCYVVPPQSPVDPFSPGAQ